MSLIEKLTPEQEELIPVICEKWRDIAFSTKPIDRKKATDLLKAAYTYLGVGEPNVLFFDNPYELANSYYIVRATKLFFSYKHLYEQEKHQLGNQLTRPLKDQLKTQVNSQLWSQLGTLLWRELWNQEENLLWRQINRKVWEQPSNSINQFYFHSEFLSEFLACSASRIDFCISVLNCAHDQKLWEMFQSLAKECGWIFSFKERCLVCDRPIKLSFDSQQRLHAEGEAAVKFTGDFTIYAYHGVLLSEKYGKLHPNQWQAQWLLEEKNAEIRRSLIQGIGYDRICQELQATALDYWQEYTLLKIDNPVDVEPIYLLKMICPSTGFIHALRVPPAMKSAREAIRWVNWGIDPEEFAAQT
jgi:hypothetical protein